MTNRLPRTLMNSAAAASAAASAALFCLAPTAAALLWVPAPASAEAGPASPAPLAYTTVALPDGASVYPGGVFIGGISASGTLAGAYFDPAYGPVGLYGKPGSLRRYAAPVPAGSVQLATSLYGINPRGQVLGSTVYLTPDGGFRVDHFLLDSGSGRATPLPDYPGAASTSYTALQADGSALGYAYTPEGAEVFFRFRRSGGAGGEFTRMPAPQAPPAAFDVYGSYYTGVSPRGAALSSWYGLGFDPEAGFTPAGYGGFLTSEDGRTSTPIAVPGPGGAWTIPNGVNASGTVVGAYSTGAAAAFRSFVALRGGAGGYYDLTIPGASDTQAGAINERGDVVGVYVGADGNAHVFLTSVTAVIAANGGKAK